MLTEPEYLCFFSGKTDQIEKKFLSFFFFIFNFNFSFLFKFFLFVSSVQRRFPL
ncbi:hypothetical protein RNJ44_02069 [Nakaseomyces bracarensis]|uniref:Uncharacterized protein n=1 Tax=Nakaseomyces bracarensis TaxID=273131 RepID=A0ABR4NMF1_9SACH